MAHKIKVIVKRPDEKYGHVTNINCTLENLQKTVGGMIEVLRWTVAGEEVAIICNEEGKLMGLEPTLVIDNGYMFDEIVGAIIVCGIDGEDFCDIPITFKEWEEAIG